MFYTKVVHPHKSNKILIHTERKNTSWWSIIYADAFKDKVLPSVKVTGAENRN